MDEDIKCPGMGDTPEGREQFFKENWPLLRQIIKMLPGGHGDRTYLVSIVKLQAKIIDDLRKLMVENGVR